MRARNRIVIGSLVTSLSLAISSGASARGFERGEPFEERVDRLAEELGLDDETRARIDALAEDSRATTHTLTEDVRHERDQLRDLLAQPDPELDDVLTRADGITASEGKLLKARLRRTLEIRALLTPEQREALVARTSELRGAHERRRSERHQEIQRACSAEIEEYCGSADDAFGLRRCLMAAETLSADCSALVLERPGGRGHRSHRAKDRTEHRSAD